MATNEIAQTGLSSLPPVIYYSEQLFSLACVEEARNQTGVFILATNDHSDTLTMAELLATYKAQQN
ncbi:hypothetical protein ACNPAA_20830, partial [Aeromonas sp. PS2Canimalfood6]